MTIKRNNFRIRIPTDDKECNFTKYIQGIVTNDILIIHN